MADVTARPATERLAMCKELLVLRERIDGAPPASKTKAAVLLGRRVRAIRSVLLGRPGAGIADDILTPGGLDRQLHAAIEAAKSGPQHQKVATALYVRGIWETMKVIRGAESGLGDARPDLVRPGLFGFTNDILGGAENNPGVADAVIDAMVERGRLGDDVKARMAGLAELSSRSAEERARMMGGYNERLAKIRDDYDKMVQAWNAMPDGEESDKIRGVIRSFWNENYEPLADESRAKYAASFAAEESEREAIGKAMLGRVLESSPIMEDDAKRWANEQVVTKAATARLRKLGYPLEKLRADMAEFYRFTGGRVMTVRIDSNGSRRANATDIEAHGKVGTINLGTNFGRRTLWHELAHHMEADPVAKAAAGRYIRRRSKDGDKVYRLRSMTGIKGYAPSEVAYNAGFFDAYVGKVYRGGITEVFAMGVETFSDPKLLAQRAAKDPETLEFIAGFVSQPMPELARAHMGLRQIVTDMSEDFDAASEDQVAQIIREIAAKVELIPDTDSSWIGDQWAYQRVTRGLKQVGRIGAKSIYGGQHWLFSGKTKNLRGRLEHGLVLVYTRDTGGIPDANRWLLGKVSTEHALAAAAFDRAGIPVYAGALTSLDWLLKNKDKA